MTMSIEEQLTSTELRAMQALEAMLRQRRIEKLRQAMGDDQSDIDFALEQDGVTFDDPMRGKLP